LQKTSGIPEVFFCFCGNFCRLWIVLYAEKQKEEWTMRTIMCVLLTFCLAAVGLR